MRATGWSNGRPSASGAGYGLRISAADRDRYFDRGWGEVVLDLPDQQSLPVPLSGSFWRGCTELRSAAIGRWLRAAGLAPWSPGTPPVVALLPVQGNRFRVTPVTRS